MSQGISVIRSKLEANLIPSASGIYKMLGADHKVLYVGKAKNIKSRIKSYLGGEKDIGIKTVRLLERVADVEFITTNSESDALLLEASLIKALKPPYNILLKDDKSQPYIMISPQTDQLPSGIYSYRGNKNSNVKYFGPFGTSDVSKHILYIVQKLFMLRSCYDTEFKSRKRPCLKYQINLCSAPCVGKISTDDYSQSVSGAVKFLSGNVEGARKNIVDEMHKASEELNFEYAAILRDKIAVIEKIQKTDKINFADFQDVDVVSLASQNDTCIIQVFVIRSGMSFGTQIFSPKVSNAVEMSVEDILESFIIQFYYQKDSQELPKSVVTNLPIPNAINIQKALGINITNPKRGKNLDLLQFTLPNLTVELEKVTNLQAETANNMLNLHKFLRLSDKDTLSRIEIYDNSHFSGSGFVGAMVVAGCDGFIKADYRKFNAKFHTTKPGDDYAMMYEVITRRFSGKLRKILPMPDLLIIDGGITHLAPVDKALQDLGLSSSMPFVCVSKGPNRNAGEEKFHTLHEQNMTLPKNDKLMFYIQNLRDEAHRFAITSQKQRRKKLFFNDN